jgi:hypothetical protein
MNVENIKLWVEALRSDEYKQGKGRLRQDDEFCCLGVACDVFRKATGEGEWLGRVDAPVFDISESRKMSFFLPVEVQKWLAGSFSFNDMVRYEGGYWPLVLLNDEEGLTFAQIADLLEAQYILEG